MLQIYKFRIHKLNKFTNNTLEIQILRNTSFATNTTKIQTQLEVQDLQIILQEIQIQVEQQDLQTQQGLQIIHQGQEILAELQHLWDTAYDFDEKIYQHCLDKQIQVEAHHSQPRSLQQQIQVGILIHQETQRLQTYSCN